MADKKLLGYRVKSGPLYVVATVGVTRYIDAYADPGEGLLTHDKATALKVEWDKKWSPLVSEVPSGSPHRGLRQEEGLAVAGLAVGTAPRPLRPRKPERAVRRGRLDEGASEALIDLTTNSSHIRGV